jgi:hypothetical protein
MSIWDENNTIDFILSKLSIDVLDKGGSEHFEARKLLRKKARIQIKEIVEKHYTKS